MNALTESQSNPTEQVLFEGHPAVLSSLGRLLLAFLTLGILAIYFFIQTRTKRYRITTERVIIETGLLNKRMEQVDLYRVVDYVVERPIGQRLLGTGNLVLTTTDRTSAELRIDQIHTDVMALYEKLRAATEAQKRTRGVRVIDGSEQLIGSAH